MLCVCGSPGHEVLYRSQDQPTVAWSRASPGKFGCCYAALEMRENVA
jgi:hypothetical protein